MGLDQRRRGGDAGVGWRAGMPGGLAPGKRTRVPMLEAVRKPDEDATTPPELDEEPELDDEPELDGDVTSQDQPPIRAHGLGDTAPRPPDLQSPRFAGEAQL